MSVSPGWGGESRRNAGELEPELQRRLGVLDEPVGWDDWEDVVRRSQAFRVFSRKRRVATVVAASCVSLVVATTLVAARALESGSAGSPRATAVARPSAALVLYSQSRQAQFVDVADGRKRGTAIRWITGFNRRLAVTNRSAASASPGDQSMVEFSLYTSSSLKERAGSGVLRCQYGLRRSALCEASFQLEDGTTLTAAGLLELDTSEFNLAVTGGSGRYLDEKGQVVQTSAANHARRLTFQFLPEPS